VGRVPVPGGHGAARRVLAGARLLRSGFVPSRALAAAALLVDRRPGARRGLALIDASRLVALLDVLGLAFLLGRVLGLVTARHGLLLGTRLAQTGGRPSPAHARSVAARGSGGKHAADPRRCQTCLTGRCAARCNKKQGSACGALCDGWG